MKVGLSCIITPQDWSFDELLKNASNAGYEALELRIGDEGEITLDTPVSQLEKLAASAADAGVELTSICPGFRNSVKDIMTNDDAVRLESMDTIRRALDVAKGPWHRQHAAHARRARA